MYNYIKGKIVDYGEDYIVLDNNDIGYKIHTSNYSIAHTQTTNEKCIFFTILIHREDDMVLYGFSSKDELRIFQQLISVSGVGAKLGLAILSSIPYKTLVHLIMSDDISSLVKAQGVGKKTAQRLVLELKDKVQPSLGSTEEVSKLEPIVENNSEAINALISLGYGRLEAEGAVKVVAQQGQTIEHIIRKALMILGK